MCNDPDCANEKARLRENAELWLRLAAEVGTERDQLRTALGRSIARSTALNTQLRAEKGGLAPPLIRHDDVTLEVFDRRGTGGQVVGVPPIGVRVTHKDTGIGVIVPPECAIRSQHRLVLIALDGIAGALTSPHYW